MKIWKENVVVWGFIIAGEITLLSIGFGIGVLATLTFAKL
jgi:hypothetical protein